MVCWTTYILVNLNHHGNIKKGEIDKSQVKLYFIVKNYICQG